MKISLGKWFAEVSEDGDHLYIERCDAPGQIHIKAESEGFVVDAWKFAGLGDCYECLPMGTVFYSDLEN